MEAGKKESASASESAASVGGGQRHILQGPLGKVGEQVERASGHRRDSARATSELGEAVINNAMIYEGDEGRGQRRGTVLSGVHFWSRKCVKSAKLYVAPPCAFPPPFSDYHARNYNLLSKKLHT